MTPQLSADLGKGVHRSDESRGPTRSFDTRSTERCGALVQGDLATAPSLAKNKAAPSCRMFMRRINEPPRQCRRQCKRQRRRQRRRPAQKPQGPQALTICVLHTWSDRGRNSPISPHTHTHKHTHTHTNCTVQPQHGPRSCK